MPLHQLVIRSTASRRHPAPWAWWQRPLRWLPPISDGLLSLVPAVGAFGRRVPGSPAPGTAACLGFAAASTPSALSGCFGALIRWHRPTITRCVFLGRRAAPLGTSGPSGGILSSRAKTGCSFVGNQRLRHRPCPATARSGTSVTVSIAF